MLNLYSFLYYTLSSTFLAIFLLFIKRIFLNKLSPRWQYGVWSVLALRMVVPLTGTGRELTASLLFFLETLKSLIEPGLVSAFTQITTVTKVLFPLPWITTQPSSITDWLFIVYTGGFWLTLLRYTVSHFRLRSLLKKGHGPSASVLQKLEETCKAFQLNSCQVCEIDGISSAFICGVFRPILAIPAGTVPDGAVLLHEFLHLRYKDAVHNLFWCYFKALNWCNPFLHYISRRIGNDLESLCDQRVLERLSGEARREYGLTLLSMANDRYARAPGTTSISNGGAFISKRIEAIARFKHYPQGMTVVSVCLCLLLAVTFLFGNTGSTQLYDNPRYLHGSAFDQARAYASARLYRCTTLAGAFDVYAKGLINENRLHIAAASPLQNQQSILTAEKSPWLSTNDWQYSGSGSGYTLYNLTRTENAIYTALLIYEIGPAPDDPAPPQDTLLDWYAVYPLRAFQEGHRWIVEPAAEPYRQQITANDLFQHPFLSEYAAEGASGKVSIYLQSRTSVNNESDTDFWGNRVFVHTLCPDAEFNTMTSWRRTVYTCTEQRDGMTHVGLQIQSRDSENTPLEFTETIETDTYMTGSSNSGYSMVYQTVDADWDGILQGGSGSGYSGDGIENGDFQRYQPYDFAVRIFWNGQAVENLYLKEVS